MRYNAATSAGAHSFIPWQANTSGAILVEIVFNYPGLGFMLLQAVNNEDFALMQGLFLLITLAVLVAVLAADFVTAWLDPRTREAS